MSSWARKRWILQERTNVMADTITTAADPKLTDNTPQPKGVLQKNLKMFLYLGAVVLLILATVISSRKKAPTDAEKAKANGPQPYVQDNTASNVDALQRQLGADKLKAQQDAQLAASTANPAAGGTGAQQAAASGFGPDGRPLSPAGTYTPGGSSNGTQANGQPQLTPAQQAGQQLAATEKERADTARFSSNIAYASAPQPPASQNAPSQPAAVQNPYAAVLQPGQPTGLTAPRAAGEQRASADQFPATDYKRPTEVNIDAASGQPYVIYEGLTLDTVLMNQLDGDAVGPVKVLVSNPVYSHDHQHILIPEGTIVLGEARKIGSGFGPIPRPRPDRRGGTERSGQQSLSPNLRNVDCTRRHLRSLPDRPGRIKPQQLRIAVLHQRCSVERVAIGYNDSRQVHPDSTHDHNPGRSPREGLFHARYAFAGL
jgi:type IV secretory pathway VirB10-like protein